MRCSNDYIQRIWYRANVRMFTLITDAGDEQANAFYHAVGMRSYADSGIAGYSSLRKGVNTGL